MFRTICRSLFALAVFLPAAAFAQTAFTVEGPIELVDVYAVDSGGNPVGPAWDSLQADGEVVLANGSVLPPGSTLFPGDEIAEGLLVNVDQNAVMLVLAGGYSPVLPAGQAMLVAAAAGYRCIDQTSVNKVKVGDKMCFDSDAGTWDEQYNDPEKPTEQCPGDAELTPVKNTTQACAAAKATISEPPGCVSPCVQQGALTDTENRVQGESCTVTRTRTCIAPE